MNVILSSALCLLTLTQLCTELQWTFSVQSGAVQTGAALLAIVVWGETNK